MCAARHAVQSQPTYDCLNIVISSWTLLYVAERSVFRWVWLKWLRWHEEHIVCGPLDLRMRPYNVFRHAKRHIKLVKKLAIFVSNFCRFLIDARPVLMMTDTNVDDSRAEYEYKWSRSRDVTHKLRPKWSENKFSLPTARPKAVRVAARICFPTYIYYP